MSGPLAGETLLILPGLFFPLVETVSPTGHPRSFSYLPAQSVRRQGHDSGRRQ